jgi:thiol-disulfide isomerase/thioredoxin
VRPALLRLSCVGFLVALAVGACGAAPAHGSPTPQVGTRVGEVAPALAGTSLEGHRLSLSAWRGSVVVVLFWASWCAPCQAEQPAINALAREEVTAGVRFLGVSVDLDRTAAQSYATRFAVPYDSLVDDGQTIAVDFDVAGPPTTFIIDRLGRIGAELLGQLNPDDLRATITAEQSHG